MVCPHPPSCVVMYGLVACCFSLPKLFSCRMFSQLAIRIVSAYDAGKLSTQGNQLPIRERGWLIFIGCLRVERYYCQVGS
jgi:hypothetical protein